MYWYVCAYAHPHLYSSHNVAYLHTHTMLALFAFASTRTRIHISIYAYTDTTTRVHHTPRTPLLTHTNAHVHLYTRGSTLCVLHHSFIPNTSCLHLIQQHERTKPSCNTHMSRYYPAPTHMREVRCSCTMCVCVDLALAGWSCGMMTTTRRRPSPHRQPRRSSLPIRSGTAGMPRCGPSLLGRVPPNSCPWPRWRSYLAPSWRSVARPRAGNLLWSCRRSLLDPVPSSLARARERGPSEVLDPWGRSSLSWRTGMLTMPSRLSQGIRRTFLLFSACRA